MGALEASRERALPAQPWAKNKTGGRHDELKPINIVVAVLNARYADGLPNSGIGCPIPCARLSLALPMLPLSWENNLQIMSTTFFIARGVRGVREGWGRWKWPPAPRAKNVTLKRVEPHGQPVWCAERQLETVTEQTNVYLAIMGLLLPFLCMISEPCCAEPQDHVGRAHPAGSRFAAGEPDASASSAARSSFTRPHMMSCRRTGA